MAGLKKEYQFLDLEWPKWLDQVWRRLRDSNPRDAYTPGSFQDCFFKPLRQASG